MGEDRGLGRILGNLPRPLLLDGGLGTALMGRGLDVRDVPTCAWNLERPAEVRRVHQQFREAGCMGLHTNTFSANRITLASRGLGDPRPYIEAGVELCREVADGALVIGDVGPTGELPPPEGDADLFELEDAFAEQAVLLVDAGVDFLHLETMHHPKEIRAALRGCRQGAPETPVVLSIACVARADAYRTHIGFSASSLLAVAREEGVDGIGANCSMIPSDMAGLVVQLVREGPPVFAQPTVAPDGGAPLYPGEFADGVAILADLGAVAVGGCCGSGPPDMAAIHAALERRGREITGRGW